MRHLCFFMMLLSSCFITAQKLKIKKNEIWLDKKKVGNVEKIKNKKRDINVGSYSFTDLEGIQQFIFRQEYISSLLYYEDKKYFFYTLENIKTNQRAFIDIPKFYFSKKKIAQFLLDFKFLDETDDFKDYFELYNGIPKDIQIKISEEKSVLEFVDYKVDRVRTDPVFIFFEQTIAGNGSVISGRVTKSIYNIVQGVKDPRTNSFIEETYIGYAIVELGVGNKIGGSVNPPSDYRPHPLDQFSVIVYNTKDVPLASHYFLTYKQYNPYQEFKLSDAPLSSIKSVEGRIDFIVKDLIQRNMM